MLDLDLINDTIEELEQDATSFENCEKLASLYICRMMYKNANMSVLDASNDVSYNNVDLEMQDILPAYQKYVETKRRYQQYEVVDKMLIYAMQSLCDELIDFVSELYHNTETEAERVLIVNMITNMRSAI
jgi:hypothetical protein